MSNNAISSAILNSRPENTPRRPFIRFAALMLVAAVLFAWGVYASYLTLRNGLGVTNLDNYFGFGLWITLDLAVIALGAGAFFSGLLFYILNLKPLRYIVNLAVVIGFVSYSGAILVLILDIGQPLRSWFGYWHANIHSMLTEVIFCITLYLTVLFIEYLPLLLGWKKADNVPFLHHLGHNLHKLMPLFAGMGIFLSFFHQGSLGGMYGVLFGRPFSFRTGVFIWPWTFFLFVLSAMATGPLFTSIIAALIEKCAKRHLIPWHVRDLLARISGTLLILYVVTKSIDTLYWAVKLLPRAGLEFNSVFHGWAYGKWMLFCELFVCGLVPCVLLLVNRFRSIPYLFYLASILACAGVVINRYVQTVQTLAVPSMPFEAWQSYLPNWVEWAAGLMIIAYGVLVIGFSFRYLPLFPAKNPGRAHYE